MFDPLKTTKWQPLSTRPRAEVAIMKRELVFRRITRASGRSVRSTAEALYLGSADSGSSRRACDGVRHHRGFAQYR